jgi:VNT family MFS transporter (synaptic vesicle glycoprotein 2)
VASFATTYMAAALMERALWAPLVVAAVLLAAGSVAMLGLPEPAGWPLEDALARPAGGGGGGGGDDSGYYGGVQREYLVQLRGGGSTGQLSDERVQLVSGARS